MRHARYNRPVNSRADPARTNRVGSSASAAERVADVAVIGSGIVGAAAALAAGQAGLSVVWFVSEVEEGVDSSVSAAGGLHEARETAAGHEAIGSAASDRDARVYALSPSTQRFLERLRVWPQLDAARIAPVVDMRVFGDRESRSALHFDAYQAATERLATIVEHRELARVLRTAAAFFPGIERIEGSATQVVVDGDRAVVTTSAGSRSTRLVIAADGPRSPTRVALGIATHGRPYAQRALVGNFSTTRPHRGTAFQWFTDDGVIALLPLAPSATHPHAVSLVWSAPDALAERLMRDGGQGVATRLSALVHASVGPLTAIGALAAIPLAVQWAESIIAPRAVLVGDAAHVIHPLAGQGLNLGLGDVEALVDILVARESFRDVGDRVLLRRHERSRAGPVHAMRTMTDGLARLFAADRTFVGPWRSLGMRLLDRAVPLKSLLVRQAAGGSPFD